MKVFPILFNADMVRAILEGRKTVTRRVIKPQPLDKPRCFHDAIEGVNIVCHVAGRDVLYNYFPPYQPGDILYVRETWQAVYETEWAEDAPYAGKNIRELIPNFDQIPKVDAGISSESKSTAMPPRMKYYVFRASDIAFADAKNSLIWRPSIHMPKEAARIFLRVTDVRVERLQEITAEQICNEGVNIRFPQPKPSYISLAYTEMRLKPAAMQQFRELWDSTIKPADLPLYGWEADPWVWVIEFERISREEAVKG